MQIEKHRHAGYRNLPEREYFFIVEDGRFWTWGYLHEGMAKECMLTLEKAWELNPKERISDLRANFYVDQSWCWLSDREPAKAVELNYAT